MSAFDQEDGLMRAIFGLPFYEANPVKLVNGRREISLFVHKHEGGSAITNFSPEDAAIYEEAIRRTGDDYLKLVPKPYGGHLNDNWSLHDTYPTTRDLSGFWNHFRQIEKEP